MNLAYNKDLETQIRNLEQILLQNKVVADILHLTQTLNLQNWYLGAGCIAQTVWNQLHGFDLLQGIKDCDLVYFDNEDLSYESEDAYIQIGKQVFKDTPIPVEIRNQARVHLWYEKKFGRKINAYNSVEQAINEWPTTATGIGVRYGENGKFIVYAPYGLNDLFTMTVRPNKFKITEDIYLDKVTRWTSIWPKLKVIEWNQ